MTGLEMIALQVLCVLLAVLSIKGDKSEDAPLVVFFSIIPVIGYLIGAVSIFVIIQRAWSSKGKCITGHSYVSTYDSEAEKWKNGRMPMRVSMGGIESYKCSHCGDEVTHSWKAF